MVYCLYIYIFLKFMNKTFYITNFNAAQPQPSCFHWLRGSTCNIGYMSIPMSPKAFLSKWIQLQIHLINFMTKNALQKRKFVAIQNCLGMWKGGFSNLSIYTNTLIQNVLRVDFFNSWDSLYSTKTYKNLFKTLMKKICNLTGLNITKTKTKKLLRN